MRINTLKVLLVSMICLLLAGDAIAKPLAFWGSTTVQKRVLEPGADALEDATGIKIKIYGVGSGKGMTALFQGKTNVAIASSNLEGAISAAAKVMKAKGEEPLPVPEDLQYHMVYEDVIVPIVNKKNSVDTLTWNQLSDLNTGKITNWKEVGGNDMPVQVVTSHAGSTTRGTFQKMVMNKEDFVPTAITVSSTRLELNEVSKDLGAVGAVSEGFYKANPGETQIVKSQPITRPLGFITVGPPTEEVQKVIDFFRSPEGQKLIK